MRKQLSPNKSERKLWRLLQFSALNTRDIQTRNNEIILLRKEHVVRFQGPTGPERVQTTLERRIKELRLHHSSLFDNMISLIRDPFNKCINFCKNKFKDWTKPKKSQVRVPQPCVLKVGQRVDIDRWINQVRMYIEEFEEGRRAEVIMMLLDEQQRDILESHPIRQTNERQDQCRLREKTT